MPRLLELFSGTGSIGRSFEKFGWDVVSLDMNPKSHATITANILEWDFKVFPPGHFDCIWGSPCCTHYSVARTTAKTPRDMESADKLVQRFLDIVEYFKPKVWFMENPLTGYLKGRRVVEGLRFHDVSYCMFGYPYKKATRIWNNAPDWDPLPCCCKETPCDFFAAHGHHAKSAQRGPSMHKGDRRPNDKFSLDQLHSMPPDLCDSIALKASQVVGD